MKRWNILLSLLVVAVGASLSGCKTAESTAAVKKTEPPPELLQQAALSEIVRHLYRWNWDEADIERAADLQEWVFWVRSVDPKRDPGDESLFAEVMLPQLGTDVRLKKADYKIEELKLDVKSRDFHIKNVSKIAMPSKPPKDCEVIKINTTEMKDYLFRTRLQPDYPDAQLLDRLRGALRKELEKEASTVTNAIVGEQIVFVAPLSPVGNDVWVFWENQKLLIRFLSDIDLANPAVWDHESMMVRVYDPYRQMVISLEEAAGSNGFMTRNQLGRALYNCIVLGQRVTVTPGVPAGVK